MAEHDESQDPRVSAGYRALGDESPPQALDAAILAASRRAVGAGPRRPGSAMRRWALPVSIAAVVVLTMSLVVRIQLERPDLESPWPAPAAPPALEDKAVARDAKEEADALAKRSDRPEPRSRAKASAAQPAAGERERQSMPAPAAEKPAAPARRFVPEPPAARAPAPAESVAPSQLGAAAPTAGPSVAQARADRASSEDAQAAGRAEPRAALEERAETFKQEAGKKDESPREWLERIARLRREGRTKEADESLEDFRKRYPDYEIPKELREAVLGEAAR
jgi:hypothetical protein